VSEGKSEGVGKAQGSGWGKNEGYDSKDEGGCLVQEGVKPEFGEGESGGWLTTSAGGGAGSGQGCLG
jgi:hypothetical protein